MSKTKWVDLEPNERQGNVQWMPRGYKVRKDTLNEICQDILLDTLIKMKGCVKLVFLIMTLSKKTLKCVPTVLWVKHILGLMG